MRRIVSKNLLGENIYTTIGEAIIDSQPGDEILIKPGLYRETVFIDKNLRIIGEDRVIIIKSNESMDSAPLCISEQCTIRNLKTKSTNGTALQINNCYNVEINDCTFESEKGDGIGIMNCSNFIFRRCNIKSYKNSIHYSDMMFSQGILNLCKILSESGYNVVTTKEATLILKSNELTTLDNHNICLNMNSKVELTNNKCKSPLNKDIIVDFSTPLQNPNFKMIN